MEQNYTPLKSPVNASKSSIDVNIVLILIALIITILLGVILWVMIERKRQEEINLNRGVLEPPQIIRSVNVENAPSPTASSSSPLNSAPTATPSALPTSEQATISPTASPSATIE